MKRCPRCTKDNPEEAKYCLQCGYFLRASSSNKGKKSWYSGIPVLGWIAIGIAAIALGLTFIIGSFWAVATVDGVASLIFILIGIVAFGVFRRGTFTKEKFFRAVAIGFFALMGASVDQTGNYLYNYPIGKIECPSGTSFDRRSDVDHPYAGKTVITQNFTCYDVQGKPVKTVNNLGMMAYRFVEYILLAYLFIAIRWIVNNYREKSKREVI